MAGVGVTTLRRPGYLRYFVLWNFLITRAHSFSCSALHIFRHLFSPLVQPPPPLSLRLFRSLLVAIATIATPGSPLLLLPGQSNQLIKIKNRFKKKHSEKLLLDLVLGPRRLHRRHLLMPLYVPHGLLRATKVVRYGICINHGSVSHLMKGPSCDNLGGP